MEEICEFRIWEKYAARLFAPNEGKRLGSLTRKVEMRVNDARFKAVGDLNASIQRHENDLFFTYWNIRRHYRKEELEKAELFLLWNIATFEPAGEECGTQYAESVACPKCKAGARQATPLFLDWRRIPKGKDIARTIAGEIVVSRRLVARNFGPFANGQPQARSRKTGSNSPSSLMRLRLFSPPRLVSTHLTRMLRENIAARWVI